MIAFIYIHNGVCMHVIMYIVHMYANLCTWCTYNDICQDSCMFLYILNLSLHHAMAMVQCSGGHTAAMKKRFISWGTMCKWTPALEINQNDGFIGFLYIYVRHHEIHEPANDPANFPAPFPFAVMAPLSKSSPKILKAQLLPMLVLGGIWWDTLNWSTDSITIIIKHI